MVKKEDIITAFMEEFGLSRRNAVLELDFLLDYLLEHLSNGETIDIYNFAKLEVVDRKRAEARNPKTNEKLVPRPGKRVKFTARKGLKDAINS